jgi:hypothetical protein
VSCRNEGSQAHRAAGGNFRNWAACSQPYIYGVIYIPSKTRNQESERSVGGLSPTQKLRFGLCYSSHGKLGTAYQQRKLLPTTDNSTHCASIASASVSLTTRTGSFASSASFAALKRRAPATTSYLLSSSSRTRRGARIPCVLKLAAFCVVHHYVAEDARRRIGTGGSRSEGHRTRHSRN